MLRNPRSKHELQVQDDYEVDPIFELLSIHKPTQIDNLCARIPRPPGSLPPMGLPIWEVVPLYWKLPIMPHMPEETKVLYREKLGKKLYKSFTIAEYFLNDPNGNDVNFPYIAMHDPHLTHFFKKNKKTKNQLIKQGLITPKGDVVCTLPEYNKYRRYLYRLQLFHIHNELCWNDMLEREKFELRKFNEYMQRDIERDERREFFRDVTTKLRDARLNKEYCHMQRLYKEKVAAAERNIDAARRRLSQRLLRAQRRALRERRAFNVMQDNNCMKRAIALRAQRRMRDEGVELKARMQKREEEKEECKINVLWERYKSKVEAQLMRFAREQQLLAWDAEEMEEMVARRKDRLRKEMRRMEDLLEIIHAKQAREIAQRKRQRKKSEFIQAITKAWGKPTGKSPWLVEQAVITGLAAGQDSGGHNILVALQEAKQRLDKEADLPEDVTFIMDVMLEGVIKEFTRGRVAGILDQAEAKILERLSEMATSRRISRRMSASSERRRSSVMSGGRLSLGGALPLQRQSIGGQQRMSIGGRRRSSLGGKGDADGFSADVGPALSPLSPQQQTTSKPSSRRGSLDEKRRSQAFRSASQGSLTRGISFGTIETIGKFVTGKEMLPTKERPPTPVPSLENLATAIMEEPIAMVLTHDRIPDEEKQRLQTVLEKTNEALVNNVVRHFERRATTIKLSQGLSTAAIRKADVIRRLTDQIVSASDEALRESDELRLAQEFLIQELQGRVPSFHASKDNIPGRRRSSVVRSSRKLSLLLRS